MQSLLSFSSQNSMDDRAWSFLECMKMETTFTGTPSKKVVRLQKHSVFECIKTEKLLRVESGNRFLRDEPHLELSCNHLMWTILSVTKNSSSSLLKLKFKFKLNRIRKRPHDLIECFAIIGAQGLWALTTKFLVIECTFAYEPALFKPYAYRA